MSFTCITGSISKPYESILNWITTKTWILRFSVLSSTTISTTTTTTIRWVCGKMFDDQRTDSNKSLSCPLSISRIDLRMTDGFCIFLLDRSSLFGCQNFMLRRSHYFMSPTSRAPSQSLDGTTHCVSSYSCHFSLLSRAFKNTHWSSIGQEVVFLSPASMHNLFSNSYIMT